MTRSSYESVLDDTRLPEGTLCPIPITLDVSAEFADEVSEGDTIALRDPEGMIPAALQVEDIWGTGQGAEAEAVFGTTNPEHTAPSKRWGSGPATRRR